MPPQRTILLLLAVLAISNCEQTYAAPAAKVRSNGGQAQSALPPNFAAGVKAYGERRYNEAISYFRESIAKENGGANAWLYLAHSYYAMGLRNQAGDSYRTIVETYKGSAQALQAKQCLDRLTPGANPSGTSKTSGATGGSQNTAENDEDDEAPAVVKKLEDSISMVRPTINHPQVSAGLVRAVKKWISDLPPGIKATMEKKGIKIVITPTMIDAFPAGAYEEVRGYEGGTSKSCPGLFHRGTIFLAEHVVDEGSNDVMPAIDIGRIEDTFKHETGHAIDHCLRWISTTEEYKHGYRLDTAHVPDNVAYKIRYYLQMNDTGWAESFAQLVAVKLGSKRDINSALTEALPLSTKFVDAVMK